MTVKIMEIAMKRRLSSELESLMCCNIMNDESVVEHALNPGINMACI